MRIMPRLNEEVNEEWISDKTRFIWDGLKTQRLDRPYVKQNGKLAAASWTDALNAVASKVKAAGGAKTAAIAGDLASVEDMFALKALMESIGSVNMDCRQDGAQLDPSLGRTTYLFNSSVEGIEDADAILIVGANPRIEAPVLNARIRKTWRRGALKVGLIGEPVDLTYDVAHLGAGPDTLAELVAGKNAFADVLKGAKRPMIIVGEGAIAREDGAAVLAAAAKLAQDIGAVSDEWNGFNILHTAASRVGGLDLGFVPGEGGLSTGGIQEAAAKGDVDVVFLLGADELDMSSFGDAFVVYIGTHGDRGAHRADVILPGAAYTEKPGTYVNLEGRVQLASRASFPPGDAREDWAIIRALSGALGKLLLSTPSRSCALRLLKLCRIWKT